MGHKTAVKALALVQTVRPDAGLAIDPEVTTARKFIIMTPGEKWPLMSEGQVIDFLHAKQGWHGEAIAVLQAQVAELRAALARFDLKPLAGAWVRCAHCNNAVFSNSMPEPHEPDCPYTVAAALLARMGAQEVQA